MLATTYKYTRKIALHIYSTDKVLPDGQIDMVWIFLYGLGTKKFIFLAIRQLFQAARVFTGLIYPKQNFLW